LRKVLVFAALGSLMMAGAAHAWQGGRVFFAHNLSAPVKVLIDGAPVGTVTTDGALDVSLAPGVHTVVVEAASGARLTGTWTFRPESLADAKGGRYWCLYLQKGATPDTLGQLVMVPANLCGLYVEAPS